MKVRCLLATCATALAVTMGCGGGSPSNGAIEPAAGLAPGSDCDEQLGVAMVNKLFAAINEGDVEAVEALFPETGPMEFSLIPDIRAYARTASGTREESTQAFHSGQIREVMERLSGLRFVFTAPLSGETYVDTNPETAGREMLSISPVMWRATGQPLRESGRSAVLGGGKIAIVCETGLLEKVLLSPLESE